MTGGVFTITVTASTHTSANTGTDTDIDTDTNTDTDGVDEVVIWDRKRDGGFPGSYHPTTYHLPPTYLYSRQTVHLVGYSQTN